MLLHRKLDAERLIMKTMKTEDLIIPLEKLKLNAKSICPFCSREFEHLKNYDPPCCGDFKCQKELIAKTFKEDS